MQNSHNLLFLFSHLFCSSEGLKSTWTRKPSKCERAAVARLAKMPSTRLEVLTLVADSIEELPAVSETLVYHQQPSLMME